MPLPDPYPVQPLRGPFDLMLDDLPGSKSLTNRALLLAALAEGESRITNALFADDTRVMIEALRRLGFEIDADEPARAVTVRGAGGEIPASEADLHLGNAGTAMRFLTAACCLGRGTYTLDGVPRMRQRPIAQLVEPLRRIGADIEYLGEEGYPPLRIRARGLRGGTVTMPRTLSSQYISALLQVGPYCKNGLVLLSDVPLTSWPYVDMTIKLMARFVTDKLPDYKTGANAEITIPPTRYEATAYAVEPDASNASYFLAAAAISPGSTVRISGIGFDSIQGDALFAARCLKPMGADFDGNDRFVQVTGPDKLTPFDGRLNDMPDMAQTLAVVALFADGPTTIRDVGNLRVKETDRLAALRNELTKLGAEVRIDGDDIRITPPSGGPGGLQPAVIDTYDDHRMAMSFAIAGLRAPGVRIRDPACVNKTFPDFWHYLARLQPRTAPA